MTFGKIVIAKWRKAFQSLALSAVALCIVSAAALADDAPRELFSPVPEAADLFLRAQNRQDPAIARSRYCWVNLDYLTGEGFPQGAELIELNLFDDVTHKAVRERQERRSADDYTWFGRVEGSPMSQAILAVVNEGMAGNVVIEGKMYQIRPVGDGIHAVYEIDQSAFPDEASPVPISLPEAGDLDLPETQADDGGIIDVMLAYTNAVASASSNISAEIQLAIDETNASYSNSGITQRLRLVYSVQISYTESGDMGADLDRLQHPSDGFMDPIHGLRDSHGADMVCLWVEGGNYCGIAYMMSSVSPSFASWAFSVVDRSCATGYYSFGHELGHNMGARHDWYMDTSVNSPYTYDKGYVNTADRWRTIMAYNNECSDSGFNCTRLQYWSNPDVTYGGDPIGVPEGQPYAADNRKTLNNTAYTIANFRQSLVSSELTNIALALPANESVLYSASTFNWTPNGGTNNVFAVDFSFSYPMIGYWSTYENMGQLISGNSWAMPSSIWNRIPSGSFVYWRVRGADLDRTPLTIVTSNKILWFYKP